MNLFYKNKLTIIPKVNLVENLGFGKNSTTTLDYNVHLDKKLNSNFSLNRMIKAPKIKNDNILDQKLFDLVWSGDRIKSNSLFKLLIYYIKDFKRIFLKYYYRFFNKI
ncbi:hypothetical protein IDG52_00795 [Pelagibacterales bacterium SAG-MED23]|nr:hypothetical protein [Pelagibacterales bacterium SAG-MED23]